MDIKEFMTCVPLGAGFHLHLDDIYVWLLEYIGEPDTRGWARERNGNLVTAIWFANENDAVAFKLVWL